ncbi:MAG: EscU/YscU/HrcU family type III secretion system export apparatus switch protein [Verrucomicrobia bacterium]|nr:EscU/YscU/HrcU family type III secretion system export apparatus switch protein [Verrucomicrobiota bacterium]
MSDQGVKTEQPTEKRLLAAFCVFQFGSREYTEKIARISIGIFGHLHDYTIKPEAISDWTQIAAKTMLSLILPMALACAGAGLLAGGLQSRFQLTTKALGFKFSRLNPAEGLQRIFSTQGSVKLANLGIFILSTTTTLLGRVILTLGAIAAINYTYQLRKTQNDLMMTRHEVTEEQRQAEGDPKTKMAMRQMARRLMQKQMLSAVATADVVITNPTHYAVALKYERGRDKAPMILAKGENAFARRIKALAAEHEVPMIENRPVARLLFKVGKVGKPIPLELYQAVADILAFVYKTHRYYFRRLKERRASQ